MLTATTDRILTGIPVIVTGSWREWSKIRDRDCCCCCTTELGFGIREEPEQGIGCISRSFIFRITVHHVR